MSYCNTIKCLDQKCQITGEIQDNVIHTQKTDSKLFTVLSTSLLPSLMADFRQCHLEGVSGLEPRLVQQKSDTDLRALVSRGSEEWHWLSPCAWRMVWPTICSPPRPRSALSKSKNTQEQTVFVPVGQLRLIILRHLARGWLRERVIGLWIHTIKLLLYDPLQGSSLDMGGLVCPMGSYIGTLGPNPTWHSSLYSL